MPAVSRGRPRPRSGTRSIMPTASSSRIAASMKGMASRFERNSSPRVTGRTGRESRNAASALALRLKPGSAVRTHNAGSRIGSRFLLIASPLLWQRARRVDLLQSMRRASLLPFGTCRIFCIDSASQQVAGNKIARQITTGTRIPAVDRLGSDRDPSRVWLARSRCDEAPRWHPPR
jgi:hypothetical protein